MTLHKAEFIARAREVHGEKYDYSLVDYVGANIPVRIVCSKHGEFRQAPSNHLLGAGCSKCHYDSTRTTTEGFIEKAKAVYGDKYDYSKVDYKGSKKKVAIICREHGKFLVTPNNFLRGSECPACFGTPKYTNADFIAKASAVHHGRYDYSLTDYQGNKSKIRIICPEHGEFVQNAGSHLLGAGCPACSGCARITKESFIFRAREIHNNKYDYSKVDWVNPSTKVCIVCPEHGDFMQKPSIHLRGYGCQLCGGSLRLTNEEFIEKARAVHEDKYDYSKVQYINTSTKVCIICPEHGEFWQTPNNHLFGAGCPACPQSTLEEEVRELLTAQDIFFEAEKTFDWLRFRKKMFLDFFIPEYGIAVECQGRQHFGPSNYYGGEESYEEVILRDAEKKRLCEAHGIKMVYYAHLGIKYPYDVIEDPNLLINAIRDRGVLEDLRMWADPELPLEF